MAEGGSGTPLRELFAKFNVDFDSSPLTKGSAAVSGAWGAIQKLGGSLKSAALVGGLIGFTKHVIDGERAAAKAAKALGLTQEAYERWQFIVGESNIDTFAGGMKILQRNMAAAAESGGEQAAAFQKLGISLDDVKNAGVDDLIPRIADGLNGIQNPTQRVATAMKLFGRSGAEMLPLLAKGSEGIAELREEFVALGGGVDEDLTAASKKAADNLRKLKVGFDEFLKGGALPFILAWNWVTTKLLEAEKWFVRTANGTNVVRNAMIALGAAAAVSAAQVLVAFWPVIAGFSLLAAKIALIVLLLDDVITFFEGGDSVLGAGLDSLFGDGTAQRTVEGLKGALDALKEAATPAWDAVSQGQSVWELAALGFQKVGDAIAWTISQLKALADVKQTAKDVGDWWLGMGHSALGLVGLGGPQPAGDPNADPGARVGGPRPSTGGVAAVVPAPVATAPNQGWTVDRSQNVTVNVPGNIKPDPQLLNGVRRTVQEALAEQNRATAASMGWTEGG